MAQIRNLTRTVQRVTGKDGKTVEIAPDATETVNVDEKDVRFAAKVRARVVEVVEKAPAKPKAAAKPSASRTKSKPAVKAPAAAPAPAGETEPAA